MAWQRDFWRTTKLSDMSRYQWESLCDGCGKCCLQKLEDEDSGEVYFTRLACKLLDIESGRCGDYAHRLERVPGCLNLTADKIEEFHWLPVTCAYRLLAEGEDLPEWHPLITGDPQSVHVAGISVRGRAIPETAVAEEDWEDEIVHWVDI